LVKKYKDQHVQGLFNLEFKVSSNIKERLEELHDITDEKGVCWATERYTYHLQGKGYQKRTEQMQNTHVFNLVAPFCIAASDIELRHYLEPLTIEYAEHGLGIN
jgi:hypothetical protein